MPSELTPLNIELTPDEVFAYLEEEPVTEAVEVALEAEVPAEQADRGNLIDRVLKTRAEDYDTDVHNPPES